MKHFVVVSCLGCLGALLACTPAVRAEDIFVRGKAKPIIKVIESESTKGIKVKGGDLIPAEEIQDVTYEIKPLTALIGSYRPATKAEKEALATASDEDRLKHIAEALKKYEEALPKVDSTLSSAKRHIEYKIASLQALKAQADGKDNSALLAIARLKDFKAKYPNCWQLSHALIALAKLQLEQKNYEEAETTLAELAKADVSEGTRQDAELMVAQMSMKAGKYAEARKKLEALATKLPKDSQLGQRARLAQAECMAATKDLKGAQDMLKKFLAETKDNDMKAVAYNTLGYCYYLTDQLEQLRDARWQFLWVDVMYNQNKQEHAKALYYLWHIFRRLNDPDRAQECWEALVNDPQFAGTEWQVRAKQEREKGG